MKTTKRKKYPKSKTACSLTFNDAVTRISKSLGTDLDRQLHEFDGHPYIDFIRNSWKDSFEKKMSRPQDEKQHTKEAIDLFLRNNDFCIDSFRKEPTNIVSEATSERILGLSRKYVQYILGVAPSSAEVAHRVKHGNGSCVGVPFVDTSIERCFTLPLTVTASCVDLFEEVLAADVESIAGILKSATPETRKAAYRVVQGGQVTTVPKSATARRTILTEPVCNKYCQLGVMDYMYDRLNGIGLDLAHAQEIHRLLAWVGSVVRNNCTIDLRSASDTISIQWCRDQLPADWFLLLKAIRSPTARMPNGEVVTLHMMSSMGNATTFPLETVLLFSLACGVVHHFDGIKSNLIHQDVMDKVRTFGDDVIMPDQYFHEMSDMLALVGATVNTDKSYYGSIGFRESCGGDFLHGRDVRPFSPKAPRIACRKSSIEPFLYMMWNSLTTKYITYFGANKYPYMSVWSTFAELFRELGISVKIVPPYFPDDSGLLDHGDFVRFTHLFRRLEMSNIQVSNHGTATFNFCRFVHRSPQRDQIDELHYAVSLRSWVQDDQGVKVKYTGLSTRKGTVPAHLKTLESLTRNASTSMMDEDGSLVFTTGPKKYEERKNGGYVTAQGVSSFWTP